MYKFSKRSLDNLNECDERLIKIANEAIKRIDFSVIDGARTEEEAKENLTKGTSWTNKSKHCKKPKSYAFDYIPSPFKSWNDLEGFKAIANVLVEEANKLGIKVRWGGDWNMNKRYDDEIARGSYDGGLR